MTTQTETAVPTEVKPVVPDMLAVWSGREEFLQWCRERGVMGKLGVTDSSRCGHDSCVVAAALNELTGQPWRAFFDFASDDSGRRIEFPRFLRSVIADFDEKKLSEFIK